MAKHKSLSQALPRNPGKIVLLFLLGIVLFIIAWYEFRDFDDRTHCKDRLANLTSAEVTSIVVGHQTIDRPESKNSIVLALNGIETTNTPGGNRTVRLTINLRDGKQLSADISRYSKEPESAVLSLNRGNSYEVQMPVKGLVKVLDAAGVRLPPIGYPQLIENGKSSETFALAPEAVEDNALHTLFNIEKSAVIDDPYRSTTYYVGSLVFFSLALLIISIMLTAENYNRSAKWKDIAGAVFFILICVSLSYGMYMQGSQTDVLARRYQSLRKQLQEGKCQVISGHLTDVQFASGAHGSLYPHMIEVDGHKFYFSSDLIDKTLCDMSSWKDFAPQQLYTGAKVHIWYASIPDWNDIPERIARLDVQ